MGHPSKWRLSAGTGHHWEWVKSVSAFGVVLTANERLAQTFPTLNGAAEALRMAMKHGNCRNVRIREVPEYEYSYDGSSRKRYFPARRRA